MELHQEFLAWLAQPLDGAFIFKDKNSCTAVIRVPKSDDFAYLYFQRNFNSSGMARGDSFQYAGIYCRRDGLIYDDQHGIRELRECPDVTTGRGAGQLMTRLEADVRQAVEDAIGNDRSNLRVQELTQPCSMEHLEHFIKYSAASKARGIFLSDADDAFAYRCSYTPPPWTDDTLLDYILDPVGHTARAAAAYVEDEQDTILYAFMINSATAKEYIDLAGNPRHPAHHVKAIMQAMSATAAKTVRVTIRKDGAEFTFKAEADQFRRDCGSTYNTWRIAAADRREYERRFGHGDYGPEDILRIEYGKTVIYDAEVVA